MRQGISIKGAALLILLGSQTSGFAADPGAASPAATGFDLVTDAEVAEWNTPRPAQPKDFGTRDFGEDADGPTCHSAPDNDADNPQIRVMSPALGPPLTSPLDIDVRFIPTASAPIRAESFRVCYVGFVTMDITKRITDRVAVTAQGVKVAGARLPHGHHHLLLMIADQRGRFGRRDAIIDVE